eukprot:547792-Amphidinium_carterae.1
MECLASFPSLTVPYPRTYPQEPKAMEACAQHTVTGECKQDLAKLRDKGLQAVVQHHSLARWVDHLAGNDFPALGLHSGYGVAHRYSLFVAPESETLAHCLLFWHASSVFIQDDAAKAYQHVWVVVVGG